MSLPESEREGRPIVGLPFLLLLGGVMAAIAAFLHPDVLGLRTWRDEGTTDVVSLSYLELELSRRPGDDALRLTYARQLAEVGQNEAAAEVLAPLLEREATSDDTLRLALKVALARMRAELDPDARRARAGELQALLRDARKRPSVNAVELSDWALESGAPRLAAQLVDDSALERATRLERAARLYAQAGDGEEAARRWLALARRELEGQAREALLVEALRAIEAVGWTDEALDVARAWRARRPGARAALDAGVRLEQAAGRLDEAFAVSELRIEAFPEDPSVLDAHVRLALARGRPSEGLLAARRAVQLRPGSREARVRLARVAEWSGEGHEALDVWWALAQGGDAEARAESERLARGLSSQRILLTILSARARRRPSPALAQQIVFLAEAVGEPERARKVLLEAIERPEADPSLWLRLARLEQRMGLLHASLEHWEALADRRPPTPLEAVEWATLVWSVEGPEAALEVVRRSGRGDDALVASMRADLAWETRDASEARDAFERLLELDRVQPYQIQRAIELAGAEERWSDAARWVQLGLRKQPDGALLLAGMELGLRSGKERWALDLTRRFPEVDREARLRPGYWRLRAGLAARLGRRGETRWALERLVSLDRGSAAAKADLLWILMELDDEEGLRKWTRRLEDSAKDEPELWMAMASALERTHELQRALPWYARQAATGPEDWQFWLGYARALESAGRADAGLRARRLGLRKVPAEEPLGRMLLGRGLLGAPELATLARTVAYGDEGQVEASSTLRELGAFDYASAALASGPPERGAERRAWYEARLALAIATRQRADVHALLERAPEGLQPGLEAEGRALLGQHDRALAAALRARAAGTLPKAGLLRYLVEKTRAEPREVHGLLSYDRLGQLDANGAAVMGRWSEGAWTFGARADAHRFDDAPGRALGASVDGDARLAFLAGYRWRRGQLDLELGSHVQTEGSALAQLELRAQHALDRQLTLLATLTANEVVPETPLLYTLAARERLELGVDRRWGRLSARLAARFEHHHLRDGPTLGVGGLVDVRVGYGLPTGTGFAVEPYFAARGMLRSASGEDTGLPAGLSPSDLLPTELLSVGVGLSLLEGSLDAVPNPLRATRWFVDGWMGWQWPLNEPAYRLEAGLGTRVFGSDELYARGYFGNVLSGLDDVQAGIQLGYRLRIGD